MSDTLTITLTEGDLMREDKHDEVDWLRVATGSEDQRIGV